MLFKQTWNDIRENGDDMQQKLHGQSWSLRSHGQHLKPLGLSQDIPRVPTVYDVPVVQDDNILPDVLLNKFKSYLMDQDGM